MVVLQVLARKIIPYTEEEKYTNDVSYEPPLGEDHIDILYFMYHSTHYPAASYFPSQMCLHVQKGLHITLNLVPAKGTGRVDLISIFCYIIFF